MGSAADRVGVTLISAAVATGAVGEYQLQAVIAAIHDQAARVEDTDWRQILALYGLLERMTGNPMVALNRAIAAAMVDGPAAGLTLLEALDEPLAGHYRLDAVRAHLLEIAGDTRRRHSALSRRGGPHDEHSGAALPDPAGRPAQRGHQARCRAARPAALLTSPGGSCNPSR